MKNDWNELDDLVIRALSSPERKNILRIVGSYPEGVNYTGILGETMLSTGRLNYYLGELDGFLERDEERRYRLTELGRKALAVLEFIKEDIDTGVLETLNTRRGGAAPLDQEAHGHGVLFCQRRVARRNRVDGLLRLRRAGPGVSGVHPSLGGFVGGADLPDEPLAKEGP